MRKSLLLPAAGAAIALGLIAASGAAPAPATVKQPAVALLIGKCGGEKCHGGAKPKQKLDLSNPAAIRATAIGVAAGQSPLIRVAPGKPEESYLFLKITKTRRIGDPRIKWRKMPPGDARLDESEIALIEAWIKSGAPAE